MVELLALAAFAALLIYAACSDVASLTIPNWVSIAMAALFVPAAFVANLALADIGMHLVFGFAVLVVGFFLFQANIIGGGDAKLLAATTIWTGFPAFAPFILGTAVAGGLLAVTLLAIRQFVPVSETTPSFVNHLLKKQNGIPYGVAIMFGGLIAIPSLPFAVSPLTLP
jgi:prepilin peptidase CpaA